MTFSNNFSHLWRRVITSHALGAVGRRQAGIYTATVGGQRYGQYILIMYTMAEYDTNAYATSSHELATSFLQFLTMFVLIPRRRLVSQRTSNAVAANCKSATL